MNPIYPESRDLDTRGFLREHKGSQVADHPEYYFGARYKYASVDALFADAEVEEAEADSQESQTAIDDLA